MIILIFIWFLYRQYSTSTASLSVPPRHDPPLSIRGDSTITSPGRSVWDILWICLTTTVAVTWVSVHPNMPWLNEGRSSFLKRRLFLICLALLSPEVMVMWAFKQWRAAVMIKETMNKARPDACRSWTMAHAHFVQMGGLKLRTTQREDNYRSSYLYDYPSKENDIDIWEGVLHFGDLKKLLMAGQIDFPDISKEEIEDRSKGNALSTGLALLQITWFIIQLIARAHQHLAITELELTTAVLAGLNSIMYLFWWNKPLDARCPIIIRTKELELRLADSEMTTGAVEEKVNEKATDRSGRLRWAFPVDESGRFLSDFRLGSYLMRTTKEKLDRSVLYICSAPAEIYAKVSNICTKNSGRPPQSPIGINADESIAHRSLKMLYLPFFLMFLPIDRILKPYTSVSFKTHFYKDAKDRMDNKPSLRLLFDEDDMEWIMTMMFFSEHSDMNASVIFAAFVGAVFESIHCAAWHSDFHSITEQVLWRTTSLVVVGICLCVIAGIPLYTVAASRWASAWKDACERYNTDAMLPISKPQGVNYPDEDIILRVWLITKNTLQMTPVIIYLLSRHTLLALALSSLRNLPVSTLESVKWTEFIPQI